MTVSSGGEADGTQLIGGGYAYVDSGGKVSGTQLQGTEAVAGTALANIVASGGVLKVNSGALVSGTVVSSGGALVVRTGATVSHTVISGGMETVSSGGSSIADTVNSGGTERVKSDGQAASTVVLSGGQLEVLSGGVASAAILDGGTLKLLAGGSLDGGLVLEAGSAFLAGTVAAGQTVSFTGAGGTLALDNLTGFNAQIAGFTQPNQMIELDGFAFNGAETVAWSQSGAGGTLTVRDGAKVAQLTLIGAHAAGDFSLAGDGSGGTFVETPSIITVSSGVTSNGLTISDGEQLQVQSGGVAIAATLVGGSEVVSSGGVAAAPGVGGGTLTLSSGAELLGGLVLEAGEAILSGAVAAGQTVSFTGPEGTLVLEDPADFNGEISSLNPFGSRIDLGGFAYHSTETVAWDQTGGSGTLTVSDGAKVAELTLIGGFVAADFHLANDGAAEP